MINPLPRLLIAEDDPEARTILATAFSHWGYPLLVAADGSEALRLVADCPVDLALLDMVMPGLSGLELIECLCEIDPDVQIVVMTAYTSTQDAIEVRRRGAVHYLPKPCLPSQVRDAVDNAWADYMDTCWEQFGDTWVNWCCKIALVAGQAVSLETLTERECDVLAELSKGKGDRAVADALGLGVATVRTHLHDVMHRFGFPNRLQAGMFGRSYWQRNGRRRLPHHF